MAGLDAAQSRIIRDFVLPQKHPLIAAKLRLRRSQALLLFGPPGTGKTLLAKAIASELALPTFFLSAARNLSRWEGAESRIAALFQQARACGRSVLIIDEADALIGKRKASTGIVGRRVVSTILSALDGVEMSAGAVLIVATTNRPWDIDDALLRPGRLDSQIYCPPPGPIARRAILRSNLKGRPVNPLVNLDEIADGLDPRCSGADVANLAETATACAFERCINTGMTLIEVLPEDFIRAQSSLVPSISAETLKRYETYAEQILDHNQPSKTPVIAPKEYPISRPTRAVWSCPNCRQAGTERPAIRVRNGEAIRALCTNPSCRTEVDWQPFLPVG